MGFWTENRFPFPPPVAIIAMDNGREGLKGHREYQYLFQSRNISRAGKGAKPKLLTRFGSSMRVWARRAPEFVSD